MLQPYNPAVLFRCRPVCAVTVVSLLALSLAAQNAIRVDVRLVTVTATVTDYNDRYIDNLTADNFIVEEDGIPQKIAHFTQDQDVPVSIGILLDTSGSMEPRLKIATDAVERFIRNVHKDDDIFKGKSPELDRVLSEISRELRSQYTLAYYPANPDDNQFHAIRVRTRNNDVARSRNGYLQNLK